MGVRSQKMIAQASLEYLARFIEIGTKYRVSIFCLVKNKYGSFHNAWIAKEKLRIAYKINCFSSLILFCMISCLVIPLFFSKALSGNIFAIVIAGIITEFFLGHIYVMLKRKRVIPVMNGFLNAEIKHDGKLGKK